jgi:hypothetical protein
MQGKPWTEAVGWKQGTGTSAHRHRRTSHFHAPPARLARLEAHRRAGGDVARRQQPRRRAVEGQGRVGLEEVVVRADLDRPVAGVGDC